MEAHAATLTSAQGIAYMRTYGFKPVTGMLHGCIMDPYRQFPHEIFHADIMGTSAFLLLNFVLSLTPTALDHLNRYLSSPILSYFQNLMFSYAFPAPPLCAVSVPASFHMLVLLLVLVLVLSKFISLT
jgi:hypothetical protein